MENKPDGTMEPKHSGYWSISRILNRVANYLEILVCLILIVLIILTLIDLMLDFTNRPLVSADRVFEFDYFLSRALNLVIGIEFTRMLCRHTPDTIIEVLMFATARQLITEHPTALGIFLGIVSIAILFALRKYLLPDRENATQRLFHAPLFKRNSSGGESPQEEEKAP